MTRSIASLLLFSLLFAGCSKEEDILPDQRKKMVSYLASTHQPRLVPYEELEPDSELPYYTTSGNTVYRYIDGVYNPDRDQWKPVEAHSRVTLTMSAYVFAFRNIVTTGTNATMPYWSNDPSLEQAFYEAGLTPGAWRFEPLVVDMRDPGIIKGLYEALLGCRQGDVVEAYMTYNMAYGDKTYMYNIPKESPVAFFFTVDRVE